MEINSLEDNPQAANESIETNIPLHEQHPELQPQNQETIETEKEAEDKAVTLTLSKAPESQETEPQKNEIQIPKPLFVLHPAPPPLPPPPPPQLEYKRRIIVKHSILGNKVPSHDPNVLVESSTFTSMGKIQPFLITISTNAALVIDYHSHLTTSEVVGYLAGHWDVNSHSVNITLALPCKCRLGDYKSAPTIEADVRKTLKSNNLTLLGWYHSHPTAPATPSIRDIETQLDYQLKMKGSNDSTYLPCIGVICSPYNLDNPSFESNIVTYWVLPPPENKIHEYGKPMMMSYTVVPDQSISEELLLEMKKCADFYKPENDYIKFSEIMKGPVTFMDKLKMTLTSKFPLNHHKSETFWAFIRNITENLSEKSETDILKLAVELSKTPNIIPLLPLEKPKFNIPNIPSSLNFKSGSNPVSNTTPYHKSSSRNKSSGKRSNPRDSKNLGSLNNYFVGSDLATLFGTGKFSNVGLDPATKSLLNFNTLSFGGMFFPPMAAAAAAAAAASYKVDPNIGLMKPPPPPPSSSYYPYSSSSSSSSSSRNSPGSRSSSTSRSQIRSIPSTSRDMPPPNKVPKLDVHQMANFFIPPNIGKNCTITNRSSSSTSSK